MPTPEEELQYYRRYFLDPKGSNAQEFLQLSNEMLRRVLKMYTGKDFGIEVNPRADGQTEIKIKDQLSPEEVKQKVMSKGLEMPYNGHSFEETIEALEDLLSSEIMFNSQFIGQMHPHDNISSFISGIAAKFLNGNTIAEEVSRVTTYLERQAVGWIANEFGYNPDLSWTQKVQVEGAIKDQLERILNATPLSSGNITVGGTIANFAAILVARNKAFAEDIYWRKEGVAEAGLTQKEDCVVFGSEYAHYSIEKLCGYVGMGSKKFIKVKTDHKKIKAEDESKGSLKQMMWQAAKEGKKVVGIVATAGTTETGSIDDLEGIADLVDQFQAAFHYRPHFHVDAAHGGGFVFHEDYNPKKGGRFKGIERADSITIDPHKMLYTHYSAGCILFKDRRDHHLLKQTADYLFKNDGSNDLGQFRVEGSMGLEGSIQTWTSLYAIGKRGYQVIQEHVLSLTRYLEQQVQKEEYLENLHIPEMNLLCFRYHNPLLSKEINDEINRKAQAQMFHQGRAYISNDRLLHEENGEKRKVEVFRSVVMHPYTTKEDIDLALSEVKQGIRFALQELGQESQRAYHRLDPITNLTGGQP